MLKDGQAALSFHISNGNLVSCMVVFWLRHFNASQITKTHFTIKNLNISNALVDKVEKLQVSRNFVQQSMQTSKSQARLRRGRYRVYTLVSLSNRMFHHHTRRKWLMSADDSASRSREPDYVVSVVA